MTDNPIHDKQADGSTCLFVKEIRVETADDMNAALGFNRLSLIENRGASPAVKIAVVITGNNRNIGIVQIDFKRIAVDLIGIRFVVDGEMPLRYAADHMVGRFFRDTETGR